MKWTVFFFILSFELYKSSLLRLTHQQRTRTISVHVLLNQSPLISGIRKYMLLRRPMWMRKSFFSMTMETQFSFGSYSVAVILQDNIDFKLIVRITFRWIVISLKNMESYISFSRFFSTKIKYNSFAFEYIHKIVGLPKTL